jgi:hypothetical protein
MVMSRSSLESPLDADPMIPMSFLRCVPVMKCSSWTWPPSTAAWDVPIAHLAFSCLHTVQGTLLTHSALCQSQFAALQFLQCTAAARRTVRSCRVAAISN